MRLAETGAQHHQLQWSARPTLLLVPLAAALVCQPLLWQRNWALALLNTAVVLAFAATGVYLDGTTDRLSVSAWSFICAGVAYPMIWLADFGPELGYQLSSYASSLFWCFLYVAVLLHRVPQPSRLELTAIVAAIAILLASEIILTITQTPYASVADLLYACYVMIAVALVVLFIRRTVVTSGIRRRVILPVTLSLGLITFAAVYDVETFDTKDLIGRDSYFAVLDLALLTLPIALAFGWLRPRLAQARIAANFSHVPWPPTAEVIRNALRGGLQDDTLDITYRSPDGTDVDLSGKTVGTPAGTGRIVEPVSYAGQIIANLYVSDSLGDYPELLRAAAQAGALALHNAQLDVILRAQQERLRQLAIEVERARWAERRALEQDLHDGAQHRLSALSTLLGACVHRARAVDRSLSDLIEEAQNQVSHAHEELRRIARGIHPPILTQFGLKVALEELAERQAVPIRITAPSGRYSPVVEGTAYYVVAEQLTNIMKHSKAMAASVTVVDLAGDDLDVIISDDGVGGADMCLGGGLSGLRDRVCAIGGSFSIASPQGNGTKVRVKIPCA